MQKATLFKKLDEDRVQCTCCQRYCVVEKGRRGFCGVRKNIDGELFLNVYGKAIAVNVDPVEKKPLYHFLPGSKIFSFGTLGCNFRCAFCQNWDISQPLAIAKEKYGKGEEGEIKIAQILEDGQALSPKQIVDYCLANAIPAIAYTYNEPTIFSEYAHDTGVLAHKYGIKNVYVSNGYESKECLKYMKDFCDAINIDIKSFNEDFYMNTCGWVKLAGIKETIKRSHEIGFWVECTTLVIDQENDSDEELKSIAKFLAKISQDIPWHVTAFHPDFKMTDKKATPVSTLLRAWKIGKDAGLKYVYIGNIPRRGGQVGGTNHGNTLCPKCDKVLIERGDMDCRKNEITISKRGIGKCLECGEKIAGVWK